MQAERINSTSYDDNTITNDTHNIAKCYLTTLPSLVLENIISRLSVPEIAKSRQICKRITQIINDSFLLTSMQTEYKKVIELKDYINPQSYNLNLTDSKTNFYLWLEKNRVGIKKSVIQKLINTQYNSQVSLSIQYKLADIMSNYSSKLHNVSSYCHDFFYNETGVLPKHASCFQNVVITNNYNEFLVTTDVGVFVINENFDSCKLIANIDITIDRSSQYENDILVIDEFYIITLYNHCIILKQIDNNYVDITPIEISIMHHKNIQILGKKNNYLHFVANIDKKIFIFKEIKSSDATNESWSKQEIIDKNFDVFKIKTARNGLICAVGYKQNYKDKSISDNEIHIFKYDKKIRELHLEKKLSIGRFFCSDSGKYFVIEINQTKNKKNNDTLIYKAYPDSFYETESDEEGTYSCLQFYRNDADKITNIFRSKDYESANFLEFGFNAQENYIEVNNHYQFNYRRPGRRGGHRVIHSVRSIIFNLNHITCSFIENANITTFNSSGTLYAVFNDQQNKITINSLTDKGIKVISTIPCNGLRISSIIFSPNSQLIAMVAKNYTNNSTYIVAYKIINIIEEKPKFLSEASLITKYNIIQEDDNKKERHESTISLKFHPSGSKIIAYSENKISIIAFSLV